MAPRPRRRSRRHQTQPKVAQGAGPVVHLRNQRLRKAAGMEYGSIEREIYVDASPEVVYEVISKPEHMREWWPDDARFEPAAGSTGELSWRNAETGETTTIAMSIVEVDPPKRFVFRWCYAEDPEPAGP